MKSCESKTTTTQEDLYQKGKDYLKEIEEIELNCIRDNTSLYKKAIDCFTQAINEGFSVTIFSKEFLAVLMEHFYYDNYDLGLQKNMRVLLQKAADQNCPEAQYAAGKLCEKGHDISQDSNQVLWGTPGKHYESDHEKNSIALLWFRKSADQGYAEAQLAIAGRCDNSSEALSIYLRLGEQNNATAAYTLFLAYDTGYLGGHERGYFWLESNPITATKWLKRATSHLLYDPLKLAERYATGNGLPKNEIKAVQLFCQHLETSTKTRDKETVKQLDNFLYNFFYKLSDKLRSPISYSVACIIFYTARAYFNLPLWARKGEETPRIPNMPSRLIPSSLTMKQLPNGEWIPESEYYSSTWFKKFGKTMEQHVVFLRITYPDLFYSLMKQIPREKREEFVEALTLENKQTISAELERRSKERTKEIRNTLDILPVDLQNLILEKTGEDCLFIENFATCVTSVEENLYVFQEDRESLESKCCHTLLEKIQPFKNVLFEPISSDQVYASILSDWVGFLNIERVALLNNPLYSAVLQVLNEGIREARGYLPSDADKRGVIALGLYKQPVTPLTPYQYRTIPKTEEIKLSIHH